MIIALPRKNIVPGLPPYICVGMMVDIPSIKPWTYAGLGAAIALGVAVWQGLGVPKYSGGLEDVIARVNDAEITHADFELALEAVRRDKRTDISREDRRRILETLINEELLVQRAVDLGLFETDRGVRKAAVDAMLQFAISRIDASFSEGELRKWYEQNKSQFIKDERLRVAIVSINSIDAAKQFSNAIQSSDFEKAVQLFPDAYLLPIPNRLLQPSKMVDYTSPLLLEHMRHLKTGDIAGPYLQNGRYLFIWLKERIEPTDPDFDQIKETVKAVRMRIAEDKAATRYMKTLWKRADIETDLFDGIR